MNPQTPIALTSAGSDSSGGAGIQADLKTFSAFGVYGASVISALTAQNTVGVQAVHAVPADFVAAQMNSVFADLTVSAIKTGMLVSTAIIEAVVGRLQAVPHVSVVVDPVMVATSGDTLLDPSAIDAVRQRLIPRAMLVTPNLPEVARLLGCKVATSEQQMAEQANALLALGAKAVLVKVGHGSGADSVDVLSSATGVIRFARPRVATSATHGTGCTLSSAIAALLALGVSLEDAIDRAKTYVWLAIQAGRDLKIGAGNGPVDHLFAIKRCPPGF